VQESVSDILVDRAREADGLSRMLIVSLTAHALLVAGLVFTPAKWRVAEIPPSVTPMMITLSGGTGPDTGGMTPISGRPVQVEAPPEARPTPIAPPAPKPPEMVAPDTKARPAPKTPAKAVDKPVDKSTSRKPTAGPEIKAGDARSDTGGAPIPFGGLTRPGGGATSNSGAYTDYANFCCPAYLNQMTDLIRRNWNPNQGATGEVLLKFTINRDGSLTNIQVEKSSGNQLLDLESQRAMAKTRALPPLPREFTESTLTVHLGFDYHR
jgi:TonB family protein